jgi:hypothetical protein
MSVITKKTSLTVLLICMLFNCLLPNQALAMFDQDTVHYGAKTVIYIDRQQFDRPPAAEGIFLLAGAGGYYTSTDAKHWNLRQRGNFGGADFASYATATSYRQGVAYGGALGDKKAILLPESGSTLHYTDAELNYAGAAQAQDLSGTPLRLTAILWDEYTNKFWCGATPTDGSAFTDLSSIYYSDGSIVDGVMKWSRADIGSAALIFDETGFSNPTSAQLGNAYVYWLSTNQRGTFAFGLPPQTALSGNASYCFSYFVTDQNCDLIKSDMQSLVSDYPIYSPDETDVWVINKTGLSSNSKEGTIIPASVTGGVVEPDGNVLVVINLMRSSVGFWHTLNRYTASSDTPKMHFILPHNVPTPPSGEIKHAFNRYFGGMTYSQGQIVAFPNTGPYRPSTANRVDTTVDFLYTKYEDGVLQPAVKLIGDDIDTELEVFTDANQLLNTSAAIGANKVVIAQTKHDQKFGRLVVFDLPDVSLPLIHQQREISFITDVNDELYKIQFTDTDINPYQEGKTNITAVLTDEEGIPQDAPITYKKVGGKDGVDISPQGEIIFENEKDKENFTIWVAASWQGAPSVFATQAISFKAYEFITDVSLNQGVVRVTTNAKNSLPTDMDIYTVLALFDDEKCVEAKLYPYTLEAGSTNTFTETYTPAYQAADSAKAFVMAPLTLPKAGLTEFGYDGQNILILAKNYTAGADVNLVMLQNGEDIGEIANSDLVWADVNEAGYDNAARFSVKLKKSGPYDVYISQEQLNSYEKYTILYVDKPNISMLSKSEMSKLFGSYFDYSNISFSSKYNEIKNKALIGELFYDIVEDEGSDGKPFDYFEYVLEYVYFKENKGEQALVSLINTAADLGGVFDGLEIYKNSSNTVKGEVADAIASLPDIKLPTLQNEFNNRLVLSGIKHSTNWTGVDYYMSLVQNSKYSGNREAISRELVKKSFDTIDELHSYINNFEIPKGSSGGGRGGSPAGGVKIDASLPITTETPIDTPQKAFSDVPKEHWAYEAIAYLSKNNNIDGDGHGAFNPNGNITRAQLVKILCGAYGTEHSQGSSFLDVDEQEWYAPYIEGAYAAGKIFGNGAYFHPNDEITREDMAVMIYRFSGMTAGEQDVLFADHDDISEYAREAVYTLYNKGIINGMGDNAFAPRQNATRAQAAAIIYRTLTNGKEVAR